MSNQLETLERVETIKAPPRVELARPAVLPALARASSPVRPELDDEEEDERSFFQRYRLAMGIVLVALAGVGVVGYKAFSGHGAATYKPPELTVVKIQLPPPPPPPPPQTPPPPQEQKMIEQTPIEHEDKPEPKPVDEPPSATTGVVGNGPPDGFGLGGGRGGSGALGNRSNGAGNSKWGWYAGQVQTKIGEALRAHRKTRNASINGLQVRIWSDSTGRITRAQLANSTGDQAVDDAIKNEILGSLQLREAPPQGMPMPIVLRLNARRPN